MHNVDLIRAPGVEWNYSDLVMAVAAEGYAVEWDQMLPRFSELPFDVTTKVRLVKACFSYVGCQLWRAL